MENRIKFLAKEMQTTPRPEWVREALNILENDFRKMCLLLLAEITNADIHMKSLFAEIALLQRPSWGCWNGFLLGVLRERRNILNTGTPAERDTINHCEELSWLSGNMEETIAITDEKAISILENLGLIARGKKHRNTFKLRDFLTIPIYLRNRIAHDNIQDINWWADTSYVLSTIITWYADSDIMQRISKKRPSEPWVSEESGELWYYNGINKIAGEIYINLVSSTGKSRSDREKVGRIMLSFKKILGEEDSQEVNFNKLLNKLAPEELKGFLLGGFIVGEKAGEGGFAEVYKGVQLSTGRKVAIKILKSGLSETDKLRFLQEAEYLSMFDHTNIAKIYEQNEQPWRKSEMYDLSDKAWFSEFKKNHGNVLTYIAMEWIQGSTLDDIFKDLHDGKRVLGEKEIAKWFHEASEALVAIHNANLIHRDVSPKNIMITENGIVKLMDFGISRTQYENRTVMTSHGKMLGSEPYMSPEQLDFERAKSELGPRSDIYSLGGTFYELFTKARLYNHNNNVVSIATASEMKRKGERPKNPGLINKSISWEISTILMGCLETEPGDRYQSSQKLKEDIHRYIKDMPIEYKKPNVARRLKLLYKRNRTIVNISAVFILLIATLTLVYINSVVAERNRVQVAYKELKVLNEKLEDQITQTEEQKNKATQNAAEAQQQKNKATQSEAEALKQKSFAEDNAKLAKKNENIALENLHEAQLQRSLALSNERLANENAERATVSKILAEQNEVKANYQRDNALVSQSTYLAEISNQIGNTGDKTLAMRLALAALPDDMQSPDRPYVPKAMSALLSTLYDGRAGKSILKHNNPVQEVVVSQDGKRIITKTTSDYNAIHVWDLKSGKEVQEFKNLKSGWSNSCISDDGSTIAIISPLNYYGRDKDEDNWIARVYNVATGKLINSIGFYRQLSRCSMSPKGTVLMIRDSHNTLLILNVKTGKIIANNVTDEFKFSPNEKYVAIITKKNGESFVNVHSVPSVSVPNWWAKKGNIKEKLFADYIVFNKDGSKIAVTTEGSVNYNVSVYNLPDFKLLSNTSYPKTDPISCISLNENGKYLAVAFWSGNAKVLNVLSGMVISSFEHMGPTYVSVSEETTEKAMVKDIAFNKDASIVVTASYAGNVKLWNAKTGKELSTFNHNGYLSKVIFTPDERKLVSASLDKTAKVWELDMPGIKKNTLEDARYISFDGTNIIYGTYSKYDQPAKQVNIFGDSIKKVGLLTTKEPKSNYGAYGESVKPEISSNKKEVTIYKKDYTKIVTKFIFDIDVIDTALSSDSSRLAVSLKDKKANTAIIQLYNVSTHKLIYSWVEKISTRIDVNFSYNDDEIIVCRIDDNRTWDLITYNTTTFVDKRSIVNNKYPTYIINRDDEKILVLEDFKDKLLVRDVKSNKIFFEVNNTFGWTDARVHFDESGQLAVVETSRQEGAGGSSAGEFYYQCFDLKTGKNLYNSNMQSDSINQIAFSKDKSMLAINISGKTCTLLDINSGTTTDINFDGWIRSITFANQDKKLVLVSSTESNIYTQIMDLIPLNKAVKYAKQQLGDYKLDDNEKEQFFVGDFKAERVEIVAEQKSKKNITENVVKTKVDKFIGTYYGTYVEGKSQSEALTLEIYKTSDDTAEAKFITKNKNGTITAENLMKIVIDPTKNSLLFYTYMKLKKVDMDNYTTIEGVFINGVIRGKVISIGKNGKINVTNKVYISNKENVGAQILIPNKEIGLRNHGVWKQDDWLIYIDHGEIFKCKIDGTDKLIFSNPDQYRSPKTVHDGWIYLNEDGLTRIDLSGNNQELLEIGDTRDVFVDNDWIYYTDISGDIIRGYRVSIDGRVRELFIDEEAWDMHVSGEWVYYRNGSDSDRFSLFRIRKDGTGRQKLNKGNTVDANITEDWIIYRKIDDNKLYRMKKDGTLNQKLSDDTSDFVNVYKDVIYFTNTSDNKIYIMNIDGSDKHKLCEDEIAFFNIINDWVYYSNNNKMYRIKIDGSNKQYLWDLKRVN